MEMSLDPLPCILYDAAICVYRKKTVSQLSENISDGYHGMSGTDVEQIGWGTYYYLLRQFVCYVTQWGVSATSLALRGGVP